MNYIKNQYNTLSNYSYKIGSTSAGTEGIYIIWKKSNGRSETLIINYGSLSLVRTENGYDTYTARIVMAF